MNIIKRIALILTIVGAINWGLIGIFDVNLVTTLISNTMINNLIYIIIGISSLICITYFFEEKIAH